MAWRWYCIWENGASSWKDSDTCRAHCKVLFKTEKAAIEAAQKHKHWGYSSVYLFPNNPVRVEKVDGRRFKGWKIV